MPRRHRRIALDALLGAWCLAWLVLGGLTGTTVWELSAVGQSLEESGRAIGESGAALEALGELPLPGSPLAQLGGELTERGEAVVSTGREATADVQRLALLLGGAVAVLPTAPLLAVHLPRRSRREREARDARRALAAEPPDAVEAWLAARALAHLPLADLLRYTPTPLTDAREGRNAALAAAELDRLGVTRPPLAAPDPWRWARGEDR